MKLGDSKEWLWNLPSWSLDREVAGTKIFFKHEDNIYKDSIYIPGPTNAVLKVFVSYPVIEMRYLIKCACIALK